MKSNDVRIGNWVQKAYNMYDEKCDIYDDKQITEVDICALIIQDKVSFSIKQNYKGIPLTEVWLVKFGFEKTDEDRGNIYKLNLNSTSRLEELYSSDTFNIGISIDEFIYCWNLEGKCRYVHQLQNLYFALTGEELKT